MAIVGRPNVGKSTLFNRIAGSRTAIIEDKPGTTRDRLSKEISWEDYRFTLIDTGGYEKSPETGLRRKIKEQVEIAVQQANVIVAVFDGRAGILPDDLDVLEYVRKSGKPMVIAVNKIDHPTRANEVYQFYQFGAGEPVAISAYHNIGIDKLLEQITSRLSPITAVPTSKEEIKIAIVGRPNVGKSMLLNSIIHEERCIVDEIPGTTRDTIDTIFQVEDYNIVLIDTAGIRRSGRIEQGIEKYSIIRAKNAIDRSDIALLVVDAQEGLAAQDEHIGGLVQKSGKGTVLIINKWDLTSNIDAKENIDSMIGRFKFLDYAPILRTSALTGFEVNTIIPASIDVYRERKKHINTAELNTFLQKVLANHPPPTRSGRRLKILYITQAESPPPTFIIFVNDEKLVHFSYKRHLENQLRKAYGFSGNPISMIFRPRRKE